MAFIGLAFCLPLFANLAFYLLLSALAFYRLTALRGCLLAQLFLLRIRWLLRSRLVALFSLKALHCPVVL
ncbi:MAG: hypothetical protein SPF98_06420 [Campylobacter sp.]|nr:hypothetical protein [Campylobacter sp.]